MKWFSVIIACLVCSTGLGRADTAADLYNRGEAAMGNQQYDIATAAFDQIITGYPTFQYIDDVRLQDGEAYVYAGKYKEAVDRLAQVITSQNHPELKPQALYWTGVAQFYEGDKDKSAYSQATTTFSTLVDLINKSSKPDDKALLESTLYYRALAYYQRDDYANAEKDLVQLTTSPQFATSLTRPEYFLRLGDVYQTELADVMRAKTPDNDAAKAKKDADIHALADKALQAFDQVANDPNALVQANEANMMAGSVLFRIAQFDQSDAGYEKALDAYRKVRREADLVPIQEAHLADLRTQAQQLAQALALHPGSHASGSDLSLLIAREQNRLNKLKTGPDPIIAALIGMAECYVAMKQPDEARTILHRLVAHATLTPQQQQDVEFQTLYSYVLGGQTDKADQALTDYLSKHAGDPNADSISFQIAGKLLDRKDYAGALQQADRSLKDFPDGRYVADAITLKARALTGLGRKEDSEKVIDDYLKAHPNSPDANNLILSRAPNEANSGDLAAALADYKRVRDNASAGPDLQAAAGAGYIQTLNSMKKWDDVIAETKAYAAKFPNAKTLPSVDYFAATALNQKKDPGAVAALQEIANKYPKDDVAPFALAAIVSIYKEANDLPAMIQAANNLRATYPDSYGLIESASGLVADALEKEKKFDAAIALYKPLTEAPKPEVAASANNKIGDIWLVSAKSLGHYQSMPLATRGEADKQLASAEQAFLTTLKFYPGQINAVDGAFKGFIELAKQRRSWGLLKDSDLEGYLTMLSSDTTSPELQARFELAKAGLVFIQKEGAKQYPAALERFKKVIAANPSMRLTREESNQFGELLLATKDYAAAAKLYGDMLDNAGPNDVYVKGDAYYGLGAASLGMGDIMKAKDYFLQLKGLPGGGMWQPHIEEANYGIALADEQSSNPADWDAAKEIYSTLMTFTPGGPALQAKAMLGYGRLLEKTGNALKPTAAGPNEYSVHYFQEPHTIFGLASPEQSAEGLYDAGQAYEKAGDKADARKQYDDVIKNYGATAPEWAEKAQAAVAKGLTFSPTTH